MIDPKTGKEVVETSIVDDTDNKKEPINKKGEDTPPPTDVDKDVTISKEEMEKLQKYKTDFNGLVEKQRLAKLNSKPTPSGEGQEAVLEAIGNLTEQVNEIKGANKTNNSTAAYQEFIKDHPWANKDEVFDAISSKVDISNLSTKEEIKAAFEKEALSSFPDKYKEYLEGKARSEVLADEANKGAGAGGGDGAGNYFAKDTKSKEELEKEATENKSMDPKKLPPSFRRNKQ